MNTPVYDVVRDYFGSKPVAFHMPGHKLGKGFPHEFVCNIAEMDITEIPGTDNLHHPQGVIREAQVLAAKAFGADETFFLVNGSTCGIHAMILTMCKPGDKLIVGRDCHKAVINGMILAGVEPVFIKPAFDKTFGISTVVSPLDIECALDDNPDAVGVIITRPNYYGICADIKSIERVVHSRGKILAVDEAHGAHFRFHDEMPVCAMDAGADICVQSAHKTLMAFTQGAYLHVKYSRIDIEKLKFYLRLLQTTSPSYIIMASLDLARAMMEYEGNRHIYTVINNVNEFVHCISSGKSFDVLGRHRIDCGDKDATRVVINVRKLGITGFKIDSILRHDYNIQVEMSDLSNIVGIATVANGEEDYERFAKALHSIADKLNNVPMNTDRHIECAEIPRRVMGLREAVQRKAERIELGSAIGRVCADTITPYPPGIAIVCPGEILLADTVEYIYSVIDCGGVVNGIGEKCEVNVII